MAEITFPKYVRFHPGDEVAESRRAWQGCPTVARTKGGRLFAGWYTGGMFEPCIHNYNLLIQSDDGGESWSKPILAVYTDYDRCMRNIDIQLWVDDGNRLWVAWTHSPYREGDPPASIRAPFYFPYHREFTGVEAMVCADPDADELVWEAPRLVCNGFLRNKPIVAKNGDYIFPAYDWINPTHYMLRVSKDKGQSFTNLVAAPKPQNCVFDETMIYEAGDRLYLHARTNLGYYLRTYTDDGGSTWATPTEYERAPSTRFYLGRLKSGELLYIRSISDTARQGMQVLLSEDDGASWPYRLTLDTRTDLSYPDLAEGENGELFIIYDRERDNRCKLNRETWVSESAKEILFARITVDDVRRGSLGASSYASRVISKGGVNTVEL